jgi:hypothetical protein
MDEVDALLEQSKQPAKTDDLPEAPASATLKAWNPDNYGVMFTIRDFEARALFSRVNNFIRVLKAEGWKPDWIQNGEAKKEDHGPEWCPIHKTVMKQFTKEGRSWYSHKQDDAWCNGKEK